MSRETPSRNASLTSSAPILCAPRLLKQERFSPAVLKRDRFSVQARLRRKEAKRAARRAEATAAMMALDAGAQMRWDATRSSLQLCERAAAPALPLCDGQPSHISPACDGQPSHISPACDGQRLITQFSASSSLSTPSFRAAEPSALRTSLPRAQTTRTARTTRMTSTSSQRPRRRCVATVRATNMGEPPALWP